MEIERKSRSRVFMDIAPLVDVVFLLLLFFMMTSRIVSEPAIAIRLPESETAELQSRQEVEVFIAEDGKIFVEKMEVGLEELHRVLGSALAITGDRSVRIKSDQGATLGLVVKVVDEVRLCGVSSFNIVTERPQTRSPEAQ